MIFGICHNPSLEYRKYVLKNVNPALESMMMDVDLIETGRYHAGSSQPFRNMHVPVQIFRSIPKGPFPMVGQMSFGTGRSRSDPVSAALGLDDLSNGFPSMVPIHILIRDVMIAVTMYYDPDDLKAVMERDPAIIDENDAIKFHTGFKAVSMYRESHELWLKGEFVKAREINTLAHRETGCDIHPGATIGKRFFIDHATGVVIGETAVIGDDVSLYQNVTLGGVSTSKGKRHPTLGNRIVVGAGAIILGNITIGDDVRVGAGTVVVKDVPPDCTVVGMQGKIVRQGGVRVDMKDALDHNKIPDVIQERMDKMEKEIADLRELCMILKKENDKLRDERK